jgi:hypothetical protein
MTVGHHERVHSDRQFWKTGRELRERYFRFMAIGAYTSMPYLVFHPEGYKRLSGAHWRRSYDGRAYRHATITRYVLGIGSEIQEKIAKLVEKHPEAQTCDADRDWQIQAIRENIQKASTGETIPLPRDLLMDLRIERREKELLLKQVRYDADREERLAAAREKEQKKATEGVGKLTRNQKRKLKKKKQLKN